MNEMPRLPRVTSTGILYAVLAVISAAAFAMSFKALTELAEQNEMAFPALFPLLVDAAAFGLAVAAFNASTSGRDGSPYSGLVLAFTGISATLNVMHVWDGAHMAHVLKYCMHSMPPVVSFVVLEVLLAEVRHARETAPESRPESAAPSAPERIQSTPRTATEPKRRGRKLGSRTATGPDGQPLTIRQQAERAGMALRTFYRHRSQQTAA